MRYEYETIAKAGIVLQERLSDLGHGRHIQYADLSLENSVARAAAMGAMNTRSGTPPRAATHASVWGNYDGPHHCDVRSPNHRQRLPGAAERDLARSAANPRHAHEWAVFERVKLPEGKLLIPGVIESKSNFIEHPELIAQRIGRYAKLVGRENVIAGSDCGYGTWVGQAAVDPDVVWAKLTAMAEGARIASREFWK